MTDQRNNAGNIGDIIKHSLLPEFVIDWATHSPSASIRYLETHAGFYNYQLKTLKTQGDGWKGERAWSLGIVFDALQQGTNLGAYGRILMRCLVPPSSAYPGSLNLIGELLADQLRAGTGKAYRLEGFDTGAEQVKSFPPGFHLYAGDGYEGVSETLRTIPSDEAAMVFVDPFWNEQTDQVPHILPIADAAKAIVVWYPIKTGSERWRGDLVRNGFSALEVEYTAYKVSPWAGQDLRGAGMAFRGFTPSVALRVHDQAERLAGIFGGHALGERHLDLKIGVHAQT